MRRQQKQLTGHTLSFIYRRCFIIARRCVCGCVSDCHLPFVLRVVNNGKRRRWKLAVKSPWLTENE